MNQVEVAAVLAVLGVALALGPPSLARLEARRTFRAPGWLRRRTAKGPDAAALAAELPAALSFLAVCLDAGQPMVAAVDSVARVSPPATRRLLQEVAADVARSERSGTSLTGVLRMHADDGRQESRDAAVKSARTVGVRSVIPLMVCFLPAFFLIGVVPIVAGLLTSFLAGG